MEALKAYSPSYFHVNFKTSLNDKVRIFELQTRRMEAMKAYSPSYFHGNFKTSLNEKVRIFELQTRRMEALKAYSPSYFHANFKTSRPFGAKFDSQILHNTLFSQQPSSDLPSFHSKNSRFELSAALASTVESFDQDAKQVQKDEKFDWYSQWYPVMPVSDLDKRRPQGKKVMGIDLVVWFDRNENAWKVFDDMCPHRLAPLSEGRIDQWGRLQCVYHGWCFSGSGDCKLIPQAPRDGPPIHTSGRACATVYPSCVQNGILWFLPNPDQENRDIFSTHKPPFIEQFDDPSFTMMTRDIPYGYEVLIENLMDPSHIHYAHHGIMRIPKLLESLKADREGGIPLDLSMKGFGIDGFTAEGQKGSSNEFIPPCIFYTSAVFEGIATDNSKPPKKLLLVFMCIPVSPGNSRLIYAAPRVFAMWVDRMIPRWMFHIDQNLVLDSDLYLLHIQERKIEELGSLNWNKSCFVPTKADTLVVAFRRWLNKYSNGRVDWGAKYSGALPPIPPREQLLDRFWTHTMNCSSCNSAYKGLNSLKTGLQVFSIICIVIVAAAKQGALSVAARYGLASVAVLCFVASKWLSHFVYKNFHFHDYDHAFC